MPLSKSQMEQIAGGVVSALKGAGVGALVASTPAPTTNEPDNLDDLADLRGTTIDPIAIWGRYNQIKAGPRP